MVQGPRLEAFGAQQRPEQIDQQAGGDGTAEQKVEHGGSNPLAGRRIGGQQAKDAKAKGQEKHVEHNRLR
jgi:hypothetical protein